MIHCVLGRTQGFLHDKKENKKILLLAESNLADIFGSPVAELLSWNSWLNPLGEVETISIIFNGIRLTLIDKSSTSKFDYIWSFRI